MQTGSKVSQIQMLLKILNKSMEIYEIIRKDWNAECLYTVSFLVARTFF